MWTASIHLAEPSDCDHTNGCIVSVCVCVCVCMFLCVLACAFVIIVWIALSGELPIDQHGGPCSGRCTMLGHCTHASLPTSRPARSKPISAPASQAASRQASQQINNPASRTGRGTGRTQLSEQALHYPAQAIDSPCGMFPLWLSSATHTNTHTHRDTHTHMDTHIYSICMARIWDP